MSAMHALKRRPWLATAVAVAAIAAFLLVIPISYDRTTGHEVTLSLTAPNLGLSQVSGIAKELKAVLGADDVMVSGGAGASDFALTASVPLRPGMDAEALAQAFVKGLADRGYTATAQTTPRRERVWGTVYAYARDRVVRINMDDKSAAELEAEIRQRLTEAGVNDAHISVTDAPDGTKRIAVEVKRVQPGNGTAVHTEELMPEIELTKNGAPVGSQGFSVRIMKKKMHAGGLDLIIDVQDGAKTAKVEVPNADALGDAGVAAAIKSQLEKAGIKAQVSVAGDEIKIEREK